MGIFRLIKGELKKIFLKSGIFIVTGLLVLTLVLSAFLFVPTKRTAPTLNVNGKTVSQVFDNSFGSTSEVNVNSKTNILKNYVEVAKELTNYYSELLMDENSSKKQELINSLNTAQTAFERYKKAGNASGSNWASSDLEEKREETKRTLEDFYLLFNNYSEGSSGYYYILIPSSTKVSMNDALIKATTEPFIAGLSYRATYEKLNELAIYTQLKNDLTKINSFMPTQASIDEIQEYITRAESALALKEEGILTFKTENGTSNDPDLIKEIKNRIIDYKYYAMNLNSFVRYSILNSAVKDFSDKDIQNFYIINQEQYTTKYKINESKLTYQYYLDNAKTELDYANALSFETTSNFETNGYDFMYFSLTLCSFVIIVYILFLGASMIAGEQTNGTLKQLAIRPYTRNKILLSKLLSTILVGIIFLIISFLVTLIIGGVLYGLDSLPILLAFNSMTVTSVHPIVLMLILFACILMQIIFYAVLSISISTLFKSNSGSIVVSILIYFISLILTMFITSLGFLKYLPFVNVNLFGFFGSNTTINQTNIISRMFTAPIANDINIYISLAITLSFSVLLYVITSLVFSKRDIK